MTASRESLSDVPLAQTSKRPRQTGRPVRGWRLPGEGPTAALSALSVATLATLWWLATHLHWLPPLFLPTPEAVWTAFLDAWHGRIQGGLPLSEHLAWSALRVFGAFALAASRRCRSVS